MATTRILLGILCFALVGGQHLPDGTMLIRSPLAHAAGEVGTREAGGNNDGPRVKAYLAAAGIKTPMPWCAAFISWCFKQAGFAAPQTAWSPALFPAARIRPDPKPGYVFGIYFTSLKRIAHCGFVERLQGDWVITIEGNTNVLVDAGPGAQVEYSWGLSLLNLYTKVTDLINLVVYNVTKNKFVILENAATRTEMGFSLQLPADFIGDDVHCYLNMVDVAGKVVSNSEYVGQLTVMA